MQKIEKPKLSPLLKPEQCFELLIREDSFIQGMLFENVTISSQLMDRLYISKCHFKNVHFEPCQFDRMDQIGRAHV